ncbi:Integrase catalytic domain-containing protein, partial [Aphis craccivora]
MCIGHIFVVSCRAVSCRVVPIEWSSILLHLIATKLDSSTLKAWETVSPKNEIPKVQVIEAVETSSSINVRNDEKLKYNMINTHSMYKCPSFLALPVPNRIKSVGELQLCKIYIRSHIGKKCDGKKYFQCHKAHNTLLHLKINNKIESNIASEQFKDNTEEISTTSNVRVSAIIYKQVLLSTAIINVFNNDGKPVRCRVLMDSGSQNNFITEHMAQMLKLRPGIGHTLHTIRSEITVTVGSCITDFKANISCLIIPCITNNIPLSAVNAESIKIPSNIVLADKSYNKPQRIDMLIGIELFFDLLNQGQIKLNENGPILKETKFGWIVAGPVSSNKSNLKETQNICLSTYQVEDNLDERIAKFWRLENIDKNTNYTLEEKACYDHFTKTVRRDDKGKFIVQLPFREDISKLGNSYKNAYRRFLLSAIHEYLYLGHMEPLRDAGEGSVNEPGYFLPHHAVVNDNSITTRLRVVFDGSSKTDIGIPT